MLTPITQKSCPHSDCEMASLETFGAAACRQVYSPMVTGWWWIGREVAPEWHRETKEKAPEPAASI